MSRITPKSVIDYLPSAKAPKTPRDWPSQLSRINGIRRYHLAAGLSGILLLQLALPGIAVAVDAQDPSRQALRSAVLYLLEKKNDIQLRGIDYGLLTVDEVNEGQWLVRYYGDQGTRLVFSDQADNKSSYSQPLFFYNRKKLSLESILQRHPQWLKKPYCQNAFYPLTLCVPVSETP